MKALHTLKSPKFLAAAALVLLLLATGLVVALRERASQVPDTGSPAQVAEQEAASPGGLAAADENGDGIVYQDGMHPWIVRDAPGPCPICGMDLQPVRVDGQEEGAVRIDPVTLQNMGVRTAPVVIEPLQRTVRTTGRFEASEQLATVISPKVGGWIEKLYVNYEGARVREGQPLFEIYSPELVSTQEEYLLALRNLERLQGTPAEGDAERLVEAARRRLAYWDVSEAQVAHLQATNAPQKTLTLFAPASGTVMSTQVAQGQKIMAGQNLMALADLSQLWLMVDVYEQDLAWVDVGTDADVTLPYEPGRTLHGRVSYLYDALDAGTRTVKARVQVLNPGRTLKPGMYATVRLHGRPTEPHPVVPSEAVLRTGEREVVVLADGDGRFRPVPVRTGVEADGRVQILEGLAGTEQVVTSAQFLIDSEARLASALGAMMNGHTGHRAPSGADAAVTPAARQPVQQVRITIGEGGRFEPAEVTLEAGIPAALVFERHTEHTCATAVQIPAFGIEPTALPLHEAVTLRFTPDVPGTFTFACGMDSVKGTLVVRS